MSTLALNSIFKNRKRFFLVLPFILLGLGLVNILLDFLSTRIQQSAFYLSESALFSCYWLLYLPLIPVLLLMYNQSKSTRANLLLSLLFVGIHLLAYPALIWLVSQGLLGHRFPYGQTFYFGLSAYCIKTVLLYGFVFGLFHFFKTKSAIAQQVSQPHSVAIHHPENYHRFILVADNAYTKHRLDVNEILYIAASSPYVSIHLAQKKYLHTQTLRQLQFELDPNQFVRIHKSYMVNLAHVVSIQSRQNGDYDICLANNTRLRLSRNFALAFKQKYNALLPQLTIK